MKNFINKFLFLFIITSLLTSCFDDPGTDVLFEKSFVEIDEAANPTRTTTKPAYLRTNNGQPVSDNIRIILTGAQRSTPVTVAYKLVTGTGAGTGVKGTHFEFTDGTVVIPANASSVTIPFQVLDDNIAGGTFYTFVVELTSADGGVEVSKNYGKGTIRFTTVCPFVLNFFTGAYKCLEPGYNGDVPYNVSFSASATANTIINNNFWDANAVINYTLNPANGQVTIASQVFAANIGRGTENLVVTGSGTYDSCTGRMVVAYTVRAQSDNFLADSNTHTFTKP